MSTSNAEQIRKPMPAIIALSAVIAASLIWLIYFKGKVEAPDWVSALPAVNATCNSLSALCLVMGYINIRRRNIAVHKRYMLTATAFSGLFLVSYIVYHFFHGDTLFPGHGWIRPVYFFHTHQPHRPVDDRPAAHTRDPVVRPPKRVSLSQANRPLDLPHLALRLDYRRRRIRHTQNLCPLRSS